MAKQQREPGTPVRVNLTGDVADDVAASAARLGISYSAYVKLRLQGEISEIPESTQTIAPDNNSFDIESLPPA